MAILLLRCIFELAFLMIVDMKTWALNHIHLFTYPNSFITTCSSFILRYFPSNTDVFLSDSCAGSFENLVGG